MASPLLYSLYTHDCKVDTAVVGLISNNSEAAYHAEVVYLVNGCRENHLERNTSKTKDLIVYFSKKQQRSFHPSSEGIRWRG